jgi:mannose-6-phosphate isomerase-like protein (cupin superfamily)
MNNIRDARPKIPPAPADMSAVCFNPARGSVRRVDFNLLPKDAFCGQLLYESETLAILVTRTPAHKRAGKAHKHAQEQFYYLLRVELKLEMGTELHSLRPGSVAHIPAGIPHQNWNDGDVEELHLEIMVPGFTLGMAMPQFVDENSIWAPGGAVAHLPDEKEWQGGGFKMFAYSDPSGAFRPALPESRKAIILMNRREPNAGNGGFERMQVHKFDQHYYVTQGTLQLDIALDRYELGPHSLAIIPAGVPHCSSALGSTPEEHIVICAPPSPPATAGETHVAPKWSTPVTFEVAAHTDAK